MMYFFKKKYIDGQNLVVISKIFCEKMLMLEPWEKQYSNFLGKQFLRLF